MSRPENSYAIRVPVTYNRGCHMARETLRRFSLDTLDQNLRAVEKKLRPGGEGDLSSAPQF